MDCLIIAAGQGTRLRGMGDSKPLIPLLGKPLIERVIDSMLDAEVKNFYVVSGYNGEKLRSALDKIAKEKMIKITHIINEEWKKENGLSVLKAATFIKGNFILTMADHIFNSETVTRLLEADLKKDEIILAVDRKLTNNEYVDLDDVTRVYEENDFIIDIGKTIPMHNAFDTGLFYCSNAIFSAVKESSQEGNSTLSGGIKTLAKNKMARVFDIGEAFWIDVDSEFTYEKAKKKLSLKGEY